MILALVTSPQGPCKPRRRHIPGRESVPSDQTGVWHPQPISDQVFSTLYRAGLRTWTAHRASQRLWRVADQVVDGKVYPGWRQRIVHRRDRTQIDHDGRHIFVGKSAVGRVGHHGENRAPVVADAFADGTRNLVITPLGMRRFPDRASGSKLRPSPENRASAVPVPPVPCPAGWGLRASSSPSASGRLRNPPDPTTR